MRGDATSLDAVNAPQQPSAVLPDSHGTVSPLWQVRQVSGEVRGARWGLWSDGVVPEGCSRCHLVCVCLEGRTRAEPVYHSLRTEPPSCLGCTTVFCPK